MAAIVDAGAGCTRKSDGRSSAALLKKEIVSVTISEVALLSPDPSAVQVQTRNPADHAHEDDEDFADTIQDFFLSGPVPLRKSVTADKGLLAPQSQEHLCLRRSSSIGALSKGKLANNDIAARRKRMLRLPSFKDLGIPDATSLLSRSLGGPSRDRTLTRPQTNQHQILNSGSESPVPFSSAHYRPCGVAPLLTPPEDADSIKWNNALLQPNATASSLSQGTPRMLSTSEPTTNEEPLDEQNSSITHQSSTDMGNQSGPNTRSASEQGTSSSGNWMDNAVTIACE